MDELKYTINKFLTPENRIILLKELSLSRSTFHRKTTVKIGENGGFEVYEILIIASVLDKHLHDLLTNEAIEFYIKLK
jgi:hypothetical protein